MKKVSWMWTDTKEKVKTNRNVNIEFSEWKPY